MKGSMGYAIGSSSSFDNGTMVTTVTLYSTSHGRLAEPAPVLCHASCQRRQSRQQLSIASISTSTTNREIRYGNPYGKP